ncbi:MAG: substrate-binding domain-containing protein [Spirochaetes bacterium]|nr:substrate-binding domain-containing protein [Spirochaetota bacterium]
MRIAYITLGGNPFTVFSQYEIYPHLCLVGAHEQCMRMKIDCDYYLVPSRSALPSVAELNKRYDGILLNLDDGVSPDFLKRLAIPILAINLENIATGFNHVNIDDDNCMRSVVTHLKETGFTRIGFFSVYTFSWAQARRRFFVNNMKALGLTVDERWIGDYDSAKRFLGSATASILKRICIKETWEDQTNVLEQLFDAYLGQGAPPEALVFANDLIASFFYQYAQKRNIRIPGDIAIAGTDDLGYDFPPHGTSFLTTIRHDFSELGGLAAQVLAEIIRKERPPEGQRVMLPMRLIVRQSTARHAPTPAERADMALKNEIVDHIDRHCNDEKQLHYLAHMTGYSLSHLSGKCRRFFGMPFKQYLSEVRLAKAEFLLRSTKQPVMDIAFGVGYTNHSSFATLFNRKYGCSPSAYRTRMLSS